MSKKQKTIIFIILITIVIIFLIPKINKYLEKRRIAKAQREFLDDDLTSTSIFDTFVPENDEEVTSKRRGRPRKK